MKKKHVVLWFPFSAATDKKLVIFHHQKVVFPPAQSVLSKRFFQSFSSSCLLHFSAAIVRKLYKTRTGMGEWLISGRRAGWLVTGRLPVWKQAPPSCEVSRCPWARRLTKTAHHALRGCLRCCCVNVFSKRCKLLWIKGLQNALLVKYKHQTCSSGLAWITNILVDRPPPTTDVSASTTAPG